MIKKDLIVIETENLYITKFEKIDFRNFLSIHQNSTVMRYFDGGTKNLEQAKAKFNEVLQHQEKYGFSYYNLFLKDSGQYIGQCGLCYNYDMTVNLCYALLEKFQGIGYATEAIVAILKQAFEKLNFTQVTAMCAPGNDKSRHMLEKVGAKFVRERVLYSGTRALCFIINKDNFYEAIKNIKKYKYRKGIGAILINKEGLIYLFRRIDFKDTWQSPEGGLNDGENELNGIYREIKEEIGINKESLTLLDQTDKYYKYNYKNNEIKFGNVGQEKKYFLFRFNGDAEDFNYKTTNEGQEFTEYKLFNKDEILSVIPDFKKDVYLIILKKFDNYLK